MLLHAAVERAAAEAEFGRGERDVEMVLLQRAFDHLPLVAVEVEVGERGRGGRRGRGGGREGEVVDGQRVAVASRGINIVVNELAARRMGFASPQAAIGQVVRTVAFGDENGLVPLTIVGVVKNSRFRSIRQPIDTLMFIGVHSGPGFMIVRYRGDPQAVRGRVEAKWKQLVNDVPFEAKFSDDIMQELYKAEDARAKIFAGFALLAVIIGCLGLFGLAAFTAERRTKEIGIRKVLGARTRDIVRLLVWQFTRPVVIANIIAWPVAWWLMRDWLNTFDDRVALSPVPFLLAAGIALAIAIGTVAGHAVRIARANPIHALRYE
jgi:putative ABC transport system permease protein